MGDGLGLLQVPLWIDLAAIAVGALSGAVGAVKQRFDLVGVMVVAILMGLGGGIIRDLLLGLRPVAVTHQAYLVTAVGSGLAALLLLRAIARWSLLRRISQWTLLVNLLDALSLGLFTIVGVEKALLYGIPLPGTVFVGVMSGVGGGAVRDIISSQPVQIVRKGTWNAAAALVGAVLYVVADLAGSPPLVGETIAFLVIAGLRFGSLQRGWHTAEADGLWPRFQRGGLRRQG